MEQLLNFVFYLGLWVLVVVGIFDGARRLAILGPNRRTLVEVGAYAIAIAVVGSLYFWIYQKEVDLIEGFNRNPYVQLNQDWAKDQTAESREKNSRSYASAAFMGQGLLLNHVNAQGQWIQFQPTRKDIADRESAIVVRTQLIEQSESFWNLAFRWWVSGIIAVLAGFIVGRRERLAANPTIERDAQKSDARPSS